MNKKGLFLVPLVFLTLTLFYHWRPKFPHQLLQPKQSKINIDPSFLFESEDSSGEKSRDNVEETWQGEKTDLAAMPELPPEVRRRLPALYIPYNGKPRFNISDPRDLLVMLHMQKTAGSSLSRAITLRLKPPFSCKCRKMGPKLKTDWRRCKCLRKANQKPWMISRTTTGWICGLHTDFTELTECLPSWVNKNARLAPSPGSRTKPRHRLFLFTLLREPVARFVSEFAHIGRGATWSGATLRCNGRSPTFQELPKCYQEADWSSASLDEFITCRHNLAHNRMTRMLANLSLVGCYNESIMPPKLRQRILVESAKNNLRQFAWFGIAEELEKSQALFEDQFGASFMKPLTFRDGKYNGSKSVDTFELLKENDLRRIREVTQLDLELYNYARGLLFRRYDKLKARSRRKRNMKS